MAAALRELEDLYRTRLGEFRRVATAVVGDAERGRDAVQEAFATAVRRRSAFRGDGPLEAWLWRLVVSHARDEARRSRTRPLLTDVEPASEPDAEDDGRLAAAIAGLTERQRLVLFLRYFADLDYATIAAALGIRRGTVAASLNTIHAALRRRLEEVHS
jgi:RNA polymerase sigma-70 factor (ECF subfamily)